MSRYCMIYVSIFTYSLTSYVFMPLIIVTQLIFQIQMVNAVFQTRILKITTEALQASGVKIAVIKDIVQIHAKQ